jgi:putative transposase
VAIIDWYSRRVLSWRISNSMDAVFCVDCLEEALRSHGRPEIFNSDQGSQFTSVAFTSVLKREGIVISMDGRGRAFDNIFVERLWRNVNHEDVYCPKIRLKDSISYHFNRTNIPLSPIRFCLIYEYKRAKHIF